MSNKLQKRPKKHWKTRAQELEHHESTTESLDSQLCKLQIKVLCHGQLPKFYSNIFNKHDDDLTVDDVQHMELVEELINRHGVPVESKTKGMGVKWFNLYQRNILLAMCDFIDDPKRAHQGKLTKLHHCKSILNPLQFKQRVTLVKVITALMSFCNIESGLIGRYANQYEQPLLDERGAEMLRGVAHYEIRTRYKQLWNEDISKTKYFDSLNMLKLAGLFDVTACYIYDDEADIKRQELREQGAPLDEIEAIPRIYSKPAYKMFTDEFWQVFEAITCADYMINSKSKAKALNVKKNLSPMFAAYRPFSDGFFTRKRKEYLNRTVKPRYPQSARMQHQFRHDPFEVVH